MCFYCQVLICAVLMCWLKVKLFVLACEHCLFLFPLMHGHLEFGIPLILKDESLPSLLPFFFNFAILYFCRMKASFNGLKGKEISLISIVLMSATIILWSWEKTPRLTAFFPPQDPLQLSSGLLLYV